MCGRISYSQQGSLKPQFLQMESLVPAQAEIGCPHWGQGWRSFMRGG